MEGLGGVSWQHISVLAQEHFSCISPTYSALGDALNSLYLKKLITI
ncbi:uncharacterized protein RAG0_11813 [Rhynchosporium agropyri]|uniref:Uncharacterized protein n=2 Tax=Rhynchosporium TaxID=38037 RepID=A0A1E1MNW6_RHYSE|nr:uncharacterized protein RAG0_11813 [Rhynchosporium agropyri]CZT50784.1 uncharacterized protein RSE6_11834 [Rhynchosporium secalis]